MTTPQERARALVESGTLLTLATVGRDGRPWAAPLFYSFDDEGRIYWVSDAEARHSTHVRETGAVAIVIREESDGGRTDAVYIEGDAVELRDEDEVRAAIAVIARRDDLQPPHWRIGDLADVTGDGPWRIYRATPAATSVRARDTRGGKPIARREPAEPG